MNESRPEPAAPLSALIVVAVLLVAAAGAITSSTSSSSQVAAAQNSTPLIFDENGVPHAVTSAAPASSVETTPSEISDSPKPALAQCSVSGAGVTKVPVNYACYQRGDISKTKQLLQTCSPGFEYTVTESKGTIVVTPKSLMPSAPSCTLPPPPTCQTENRPALSSLSSEKCRVKYCVEVGAELFPGSSQLKNGCFNAESGANGAPPDVASLRRGAIDNLAKTLSLDEAQQVLPELTSGLPQSDQDAIREALAGPTEERVASIGTQRGDIAKQLEALAGCTSVRCQEDASMLKYNDMQLERQQAALQAQLDALKNNANTLSPCGSEVCASAALLDENGQHVDERFRPVASNNEQQPPPSTFPPPQSPPPASDSGIGGIVSGLMNALKGLGGGGGGGGGSQPPGSQPQMCTPQVLCTNNTLFSRSSACTDTPIQQCQYGCAGTACAAPPSQDQAAAQISCQPQVADVGMSVAVSYSCSAGTSAGMGFDTQGAQSGTSTVVVSNSATDAHTLALGLACTDRGVTSNASCNVQVSDPWWVLVAIPKIVQPGETSRVGWATTGMESCVISSLDLLPFTTENANNKSKIGSAETPPLTGDARMLLRCVTLGGGIREATTTISVQQ